MDETDFELLRVLYETKNITRASEKLYVTQSSISKRIQAIERDIGNTLLQRSRQGIRFTPAGEIVLKHCLNAEREMKELRSDVESLSGEVCGTLNAGFSENYTIYRLPDVLSAYHYEYPQVNLNITTGRSRDIYRHMLDGRLDVAVIRGEFAWDGIQYLLSQESMCLVYDQKYKDLPLKDFMLIRHRSDPAQEALILRWMHEQGLTHKPIGFQVDSINACLEMVRRGLGWSILPEIALDNYTGIKQACYFESGEPFVRRCHVYCQRDAADLPQVNAFIEMIKKYSRKG